MDKTAATADVTIAREILATVKLECLRAWLLTSGCEKEVKDPVSTAIHLLSERKGMSHIPDDYHRLARWLASHASTTDPTECTGDAAIRLLSERREVPKAEVRGDQVFLGSHHIYTALGVGTAELLAGDINEALGHCGQTSISRCPDCGLDGISVVGMVINPSVDGGLIVRRCHRCGYRSRKCRTEAEANADWNAAASRKLT